MLFTVELKDVKNNDPSQIEVEIYCDSSGLDFLIGHLQNLKNQTGGGHAHFNTTEWAGNELTSEIQGKGNYLVNHLVIAKKT